MSPATSRKVRKSKTDAGIRVIPLHRAAVNTLARLRQRAELFGEALPEHFVFASFKPVGRFERDSGGRLNKSLRTDWELTRFDPTTPLKSWRTAWRNLTKKAGLSGFRFHPELLEAGVPEQTVMAIAGHVSKRMLARYSHTRLTAKRAALEALEIGSRRDLRHDLAKTEPVSQVSYRFF